MFSWRQIYEEISKKVEMVDWMMNGVNHNDSKGLQWMDGLKKVLKGADEWQWQRAMAWPPAEDDESRGEEAEEMVGENSDSRSALPHL